MKVTQLDHLNLTVRDLREALRWYRRVFGFEIVESGEREGGPWAIVQSGDAILCLVEVPGKEAPPLWPEVGAEHRVNHYGLRIDDRERWEETLRSERVQVDYGGPIRWPNSISWYIRDPSGVPIEVALWDVGAPTFPADSDVSWSQSAEEA